MSKVLKNWKSEFDPWFKDAIRLRDAGEHADGLPIVERILADDPQAFPALMLRAHLLYELERFGESAEAFRKAVEVRRESETASLGLFFSLAIGDQFQEAANEMERFLKKGPSEEYLQVCLDYPDEFRTLFQTHSAEDYPMIVECLNWAREVTDQWVLLSQGDGSMQ